METWDHLFPVAQLKSSWTQFGSVCLVKRRICCKPTWKNYMKRSRSLPGTTPDPCALCALEDVCGLPKWKCRQENPRETVLRVLPSHLDKHSRAVWNRSQEFLLCRKLTEARMLTLNSQFQLKTKTTKSIQSKMKEKKRKIFYSLKSVFCNFGYNKFENYFLLL